MRTLPSTRLRAVVLPITLVMVVACGGQTPAAPSPSTVAVASLQPPDSSPSGDPIGSPVATPVSNPTPTSTPSSTPTSTPATPTSAAAWSKASVIFQGECGSPTATIDATGRFHVVAGCGMSIRYATSTDGRSWRTMTFRHPSNRLDTGPQIAIDGSTLYVAFTRLRPTDGGCGDDGLVDVGVYYRTRQLTADAWTDPVRIGSLADHLQSFRVKDGVIHWTFVGHDGRGPISYGRRSGSTFKSVVLPRALETSLRVGDDGLARIAYSTGDRIRYGTVHSDGSLTSKTIFASKDMVATWPNLVLGADDHAYVTFAAHLDVSGGCAEPDNPVSKPGTYFATNESGTWVVRRLTKDIGPASLVVDARTGQISIALELDRGIREYTRTPNGVWSGATIRGTGSTGDAVIRRDPTRGDLLLVATRWDEDLMGTQVIALVKR